MLLQLVNEGPEVDDVWLEVEEDEVEVEALLSVLMWMLCLVMMRSCLTTWPLGL